MAIIGDYNIGGDAWSSRILLEEIGLRVIAQWSGDGTIAELENKPVSVAGRSRSPATGVAPIATSSPTASGRSSAERRNLTGAICPPLWYSPTRNSGRHCDANDPSRAGDGRYGLQSGDR